MQPEHEPPEWSEWRANPEAFHNSLTEQFAELDHDQLVDLARQTLSTLAATPASQRTLIGNLVGAVDRSLGKNDLEGAERFLVVAETIAALGNAWATAECHYWRGRLEEARGRPELAISHFEQAIAGIEDPEKQVIALHSLAFVFFHAGNLARARQHFQETIVIARTHANARGLIHSYLGLAQVARASNDPPEAQHWLKQAHQAAQAAGTTEGIAQILGEQGLLSAQAGDLSAAREHYRELEEFMAEQPDALPEDERLRARSALLSNKASAALRAGDIEAARRLAEESLVQEQALPVKERIENLDVAGKIDILAGDLAAGKRRLLSTFRQTEAMDYPDLRFLSGLGLGVVYALEGAYEPAHRVCAAAIDALERMRGQVGDAIARLGYIRDKMEIYELIVKLSIILADLREMSRYQREALAYVERAKSRTLIEALGTTSMPPPPGVPAALRRAEAEGLARARELEARMRAVGQEREAAQRAYNDVQEQLGVLWQRIAEHAPEYVALRRGQPQAFNEIRGLLRA